MKYRLIAILVISLALLGSGCKKEGSGILDCNNLKQGLLLSSKETVRQTLERFLVAYSQENVNRLAAAISEKCTVTATVDCFECIKTLPPQTEIRVLFSDNGFAVRRVLDISYTPDNKMTLVGLHE